jgi:hypothetical protein
MDVLVVDAGLALVGLGLLSLLRPLRFLRIRTRGQAAAILAGGVVLLALGLALPVTPPSLPGPRMALDAIVPRYQFGEHHEIRIAAPPARVYAAVRASKQDEWRSNPFKVKKVLQAIRNALEATPSPGSQELKETPI